METTIRRATQSCLSDTGIQSCTSLVLVAAAWAKCPMGRSCASYYAFSRIKRSGNRAEPTSPPQLVLWLLGLMDEDRRPGTTADVKLLPLTPPVVKPCQATMEEKHMRPSRAGKPAMHFAIQVITQRPLDVTQGHGRCSRTEAVVQTDDISTQNGHPGLLS